MNDKNEPVQVETPGRRVIFYANNLSKLDWLVQCATQGYITHVLVAFFHLGYDDRPNNTKPYVHLNNVKPDDPMYNALWNIVPGLQSKGVKVMGSLGGGSVSDFRNSVCISSELYDVLRDAEEHASEI